MIKCCKILSGSEIHTVKLGFIGPISDPYSSEGTAARNAFQIAVDEANSSGRFPYIIELVIADDRSNDERLSQKPAVFYLTLRL